VAVNEYGWGMRFPSLGFDVGGAESSDPRKC